MYKFVIFVFLLHSALFSKLTAYDQTFIIERIQNGFEKEDPEEIFQWRGTESSLVFLFV
jgi:hypothetical protein